VEGAILFVNLVGLNIVAEKHLEKSQPSAMDFFGLVNPLVSSVVSIISKQGGDIVEFNS
jgi:hypothetical protein